MSIEQPRSATGMAPVVTELDAVIVGAGFAGLYMLHRLRGLGLTARVIEAADGVGGTWYWNRYPGARCDIESLEYQYGFEDELPREWKWTERYASQPEILRYINHVADRFDLRRDIQFETRVTSAHFDESTNRWDDRDRPRRASVGGVLHHGDRLPLRAAASRLQGPRFVRGRLVPHRLLAARRRRLHRQARRHHRHRVVRHPVDPDHRRAGRAPHRLPAHGELQRARAQRPHRARVRAADDGALHRSPPPRARDTTGGVVSRTPNEKSALEVSEEERQQEFESRWQQGGFALGGAFADLAINSEANDTAAEFVRAKIRATVKDPATAELLCPKDYPFATKRLCVDTNYFETFNRDNVSLVDVKTSPIEEITPTGLRTADAEYAFDCLVFATGFDAMTGALLEHRYPRPRRARGSARSGRPARAPTSACRSPASRTSSRSPARAARRC